MNENSRRLLKALLVILVLIIILGTIFSIFSMRQDVRELNIRYTQVVQTREASR